MPQPLFPQTAIAVIWDFDNTLIPGNMQAPIFQEYGINEPEFWAEVNGLASYYEAHGVQVSPDTLYLNHFLTYIKAGRLPGLSNQKLRDLGARLTFFPGLPEFLPALAADIEGREEFSRHAIHVEHYVVSTGLRQMILGSVIAPYVSDVWACEFVEEPAPMGYLNGGQRLLPMQVVKGGRPRPSRRESVREISQVVYQLDNTTKTRAIFEINKGTNKDARINVNDTIALEDRRVPFQNMIYVADGPSDIPVFSILNNSQGTTYAVFGESEGAFEQAYSLQEQKRVRSIGAADYRPGSTTYRWLMYTVTKIAQRIAADRDALISTRVHAAPRHLAVEDDEAQPAPAAGAQDAEATANAPLDRVRRPARAARKAARSELETG